MTLSDLEKQFLSKEWKTRESARKKIIQKPRKDALRIFVKLLKHHNPTVRMDAAAGLRSLADDNGAKALIKSINNPNNKKYNGSMVYALQTHDCVKYFMQIFKVALYGDYEAQNHALKILQKQKFIVNRGEIQKAHRMIKSYEKRKNRCLDYKLLIGELVRNLKKIERQALRA